MSNEEEKNLEMNPEAMNIPSEEDLGLIPSYEADVDAQYDEAIGTGVNDAADTFKSLHPYQQLQLIASTTGVTLNKPNPKCSTCKGNGYVGYTNAGDARVPIACPCVLRPEDRAKYVDIGKNGVVKLGRAERRKAERRNRILTKRINSIGL